MSRVTIRYWAAAKEAAGVSEQNVTADTLAEALTGALQALESGTAVGGPADGARLRTILTRSSFLIDGDPVGRRAAESVLLRDGSVVEVLPPFAGG